MKTHLLILALLFNLTCVYALKPKVGYSGFDNARTVTLVPHGNIPKGWEMKITAMGAQWSEKHKDSVLIIVAVINDTTAITGASLNIDGEIIHMKQTGDVTGFEDRSGIKQSSKSFTTELLTIRKILKSERTWLRVNTPHGTMENAVIENGKKGQAFVAFEGFIAVIDKKETVPAENKAGSDTKSKSKRRRR